jgi:hypothetical protein
MPCHEIRWNWTCKQGGGELELSEGMCHYWLEPVFVREV